MASGAYRLLLIETDAVQRDLTAYRLELLGYSVSVADRLLEAWRQVDDSKPHAILLTLDDDRLDPFDLMEQFASDNDTAKTPLMVMSREADLHRVETAWKSGAVDYLVTPYDPVILEKKVSQLLDRVTADLDGESEAMPSGEQALREVAVVAVSEPTMAGMNVS